MLNKQDNTVKLIMLLAAIIIIVTSLAACGGTRTGGDRFEFGEWRGKPIVWRVLDTEDNRTLLISEDILAVRQYHGFEEEYGERLSDIGINRSDINEKITWADSEIRAWLNDDFLNDAFSKYEQESILLSEIPNPDNEEYVVDGGRDTKDRIFLLSTDEARRYFDNDRDRAAYIYLTEEDLADIEKFYIEDLDWDPENQPDLLESDKKKLNQKQEEAWWLRSPAGEPKSGRYNLEFGHVGGGSSDVGRIGGNLHAPCYLIFGVRPALWINLEP